MTTFSCLFNAPGSLRSSRSQRPPRTTVARGASHVTHGVTEPRKITGYSLSSCNNLLDNSSTIHSSLNLNIGKLKRTKNQMKKYKKKVKKENLRYFRAFEFLENLLHSEESSNVEKTWKKKGADGNRIMKTSQDESTSGSYAVTKTSTPGYSSRLYRARETGKTRLRDQLISRKTSRVPAPSVDPESVDKTKSVGGSRGLYKIPRLESNFNQIIRTITRIEASRSVTSPQKLPSANVLQGSPSKHIESKREEQNSSARGQSDLTKELESCLLFKRKFLETMIFRKEILKIIKSGRYNLPEKEEFARSCLVNNTILYNPIRGGLTLESHRPQLRQ